MTLINRKQLYAWIMLTGMIPTLGLAGGHGDEAASGDYPGYMPLTPPLVVNLANPRKARYLRLDVEFQIDTPDDADLVTHHMPRIRDRMITLLGGRDGDTIMTSDARDQLRADLLESLRKMMMKLTGRPAISGIFFTGFIVQ